MYLVISYQPIQYLMITIAFLWSWRLGDDPQWKQTGQNDTQVDYLFSDEQMLPNEKQSSQRSILFIV